MESKDDKIKKIFSSKFSNFEPEIPASSWNSINRALEEQVAPKRTNWKRISIVATGVAAAIALMLISLPDFDQVKVTDSGEVTKVETKQTTDRNKKEDIAQPTIQEQISGSTIGKLGNSYARATNIASANTGRYKSNTGSTSRVERQLESLILEEDNTEVQHPASDSNAHLGQNKDLKDTELSLGNKEATPRLLIPKKTDADKKIAISVKSNMGLLSSNMTQQDENILFSKSTRSSKLFDILEKENSEFDIEHRQPISVGVLVSKQISSRFAIETGIQYTHLTSKIRSNSTIEVDEDMKFDYLGIPINLNYTLFSIGNLSIYGSVGAMIQKDIKGSYTSKLETKKFELAIESENLANNNLRRSSVFMKEPGVIKESIKQSHVQVSAHGLLGATYPIYKAMNVYGSAGVAHYFDADNKHRTIYSDKKTQLAIDFGFKFSF